MGKIRVQVTSKKPESWIAGLSRLATTSQSGNPYMVCVPKGTIIAIRPKPSIRPKGRTNLGNHIENKAISTALIVRHRSTI
jgi:hypothetical protein